MTDYIKREDAIEAFEPRQRRDWYTPWIVETLKDLPSADVVPMERYKSMENTCVKLQKSLADVAPVRHGRWVESFKVNAPPTLKERWICSWCGNVQTYGITDYCPNCGARMDGESDE